MSISNYFKPLLVICAHFGSMLTMHGEQTEASIAATFTIDYQTEEIIKNDVATADNIVFTANGVWDDSGYYLISPNDLITIKAEEFQNIWNIRLVAQHFDESYPVSCKIIDAKGSEFSNLQDLNEALTVTSGKITIDGNTELSDIYTFDFGGKAQLSEVTFQVDGDFYFYRASVSLAVDPIVGSDELKLYSDDIVPFKAQSNWVPYQYYISNDTEHIETSRNNPEFDDDFSDHFSAVPEDGITMTGKPDGKYVVYIDTDPFKVTSAPYQKLGHVIVNYQSVPNSTAIDAQESNTTEEYFDIVGRHIKSPRKGFQIIKLPSGARKVCL